MTDTIDPEFRLRNAAFRLVLLSFGAGVLLVAVGYLPTRTLAGPDGVGGLLVGVGIALIGTLVGLVPPLLSFRHPDATHAGAILAGMVVRFLLTLALLVAALLAAFCDRAALAVWTAIGYIVLLVIDVVGLAGLIKRSSRTSS